MLELSLALGKTLEELRAMPAADFWLYRRYYAKQPFGQWRGDYRAALVARTQVGGKLKDFMPLWDGEQDDEEVMTDLLGGSVVI